MAPLQAYRPTAGKHSNWWGHFRKFDPRHHKGYENKAAYMVCFEKKESAAGTVSIKGGSTTGITRHFKHHHRDIFDEQENKRPAPKKSDMITNAFPVREKEKFLGIKETKGLYKTAAATLAIEEAVPFKFKLFNSEYFRACFRPFNKKADQVTNVNRKNIREEMMTMGRLAKAATKIEVKWRIVSYSTP